MKILGSLYANSPDQTKKDTAKVSILNRQMAKKINVYSKMFNNIFYEAFFLLDISYMVALNMHSL